MKRFFKHPAIRRALAWALARALVLVLRSIRWRVEGEAVFDTLVSGPPGIVAFWHESLPVLPVVWLMAGKRGMARQVAVLASKNADGQLIGQVMRRLGTELVSGSSSQGGREAMEALVAAMAAGRHVAMTPDGPRGPRRRAHFGVARLAARSGAAVVPVGAASRPAITIGSWDSMRIPLPFGRGVLRFGTPILLPAKGWEERLPEIEVALTNELDAALAQCS